jgi:diaminohydroxyphosphoribosylaminopyrimidine deaminase/5-amino-6-(5-phosphoribosylamino)uracil reductase
MRRALQLAKRGLGKTSPNPMVGAVLVKNGKIIGEGWHHQAGAPHAEILALRAAAKKDKRIVGSSLYVTLEPCCTHGRTPPCTTAILNSGIKFVIGAATDPNPKHAGKGFTLLEQGGVRVKLGILEPEATALNEAFNHWIVHKTPFITVKAAMTLDGKIATALGKSKWITSPKARQYAMDLRRKADAVLVGINTIINDDPSLTLRDRRGQAVRSSKLRRIILDSQARTPLQSQVLTDGFAQLTTIIVGESAPIRRLEALGRKALVLLAPEKSGKIDLRWVLRKLGAQNVTSLLVEGGGEVNASFLLRGHTHRVAFFYAPKILGGRNSLKSVGGEGVKRVHESLKLKNVKWHDLGPDFLLEAEVIK